MEKQSRPRETRVASKTVAQRCLSETSARPSVLVVAMSCGWSRPYHRTLRAALSSRYRPDASSHENESETASRTNHSPRFGHSFLAVAPSRMKFLSRHSTRSRSAASVSSRCRKSR